MNELDKIMNDWNELRVEKKVRIGRDIAKEGRKEKRICLLVMREKQLNEM
jgi:hypothetical protein